MARSDGAMQTCCRIRFHRPYIYSMTSPAVKLTLQQSKFDAEGFASTSRACSSTLVAMSVSPCFDYKSEYKILFL